jgi:hypothetical protein
MLGDTDRGNVIASLVSEIDFRDATKWDETKVLHFSRSSIPSLLNFLQHIG